MDLQEAIIKHKGTTADFKVALDIIDREYRPVFELSLSDKLESLGELFDLGMSSQYAGIALLAVLKGLANHSCSWTEMVDILNNATYPEYYAVNLFGIRGSAASLHLSKLNHGR